MKYFVLRKDGRQWVRTNWTSPGAIRPRAVTSKVKADICLKDARDSYPKEKYKIEVVR
jgi:hypothetical protein